MEMRTHTLTQATDLAGLRRAANLTQVDLASLADCSPAMIQRLDPGYRPRHSKVLLKGYAAAPAQRQQG